MRFEEVHKYSNDWLNALTHEEIAAQSFPLVINRTQEDVDKLISLCEKGWGKMTEEERTYFLAANSRGAYNISDILRVNVAQARLRVIFNNLATALADDFDIAVEEVLQSLKYNKEYYDLSETVLDPSLKELLYETPVTLETIEQGWINGDYPADYTDEENGVLDISYYLDNVNILRSLIPVEAPETPESLEGLDYEKANDIERILVAVYNAYEEYREEKEGAIWDAEDAEIDKQDRAARSWIWSNEAFAGEV